LTKKQENIIAAALELFAKEGYHATSTSMVAKRAGVSEGLIFRHFGKKEGLLNAVLETGQEQMKNLYADIVLETDPHEVIRKTIELPFSVPEAEHEFWRLQYKLKWELNLHNQEKMEPLLLALSNAFSKLDCPQPQLEAEFLLQMIDSLGGAILKKTLKNPDRMRQFLLEKYR
jgi:AcrR family transcriptional regulator